MVKPAIDDIYYSDDKVEAYRRAMDARQKTLRFVIGVNSGGVIAALGLIGTILSGSDNNTFSVGLFWTLVIFLVGMGAGWVGLIAQERRSLRMLKYIEDAHLATLFARNNDEDEPEVWAISSAASNHLGINDVVHRASVTVASICLLVGAVSGLYGLWQFTF